MALVWKRLEQHARAPVQKLFGAQLPLGPSRLTPERCRLRLAQTTSGGNRFEIMMLPNSQTSAAIFSGEVVGESAEPKRVVMLWPPSIGLAPRADKHHRGDQRTP